MIHVDTHVLVWLLAGESRRIPRGIRQRLDRDEVAISPIVELELAYLYEVERIRMPAAEVLAVLGPVLDLVPASSSFSAVVTQATALRWTRDPFDRLIAAHAMADSADLATADTTILANCPNAVWNDD